MLIRTASQRPVKHSILFFDREIIDACVPKLHQAAGLELPVLVSVRTIPLPRIVVRFIREANSNPVSVATPELFNKAILKLFGPLPRQKCDGLLSTSDKLRAIAPVTILSVTSRDLLWITRIPLILNCADLQNRSLT